jgi:4-hydroxyproline epimerase
MSKPLPSPYSIREGRDGHSFFCIDAHTCGNPVRLVAAGGPALEGQNMSEKRQHFLREFDWIRKGLMFEPRGHDMMSGSILYPPHNSENDLSVLFIETSGCLPMCGHGTIGTATIAIEEGLVHPLVPGVLRVETPAGLIVINYKQQGKKVVSVKFTNVPAYLEAEQIDIYCSGLGQLKVDLSYGGNFYAIVDIQPGYKGLEHYPVENLISWGREIRKAVNQNHQCIHPLDPTIHSCSHVLWGGTVLDPASSARNAVFYGDKAIDRSPCGTGTSARMAQWFAQGKLKKGDSFIHESIIGSVFSGQIEQLTSVAGKSAIIPSIQGWATIYGFNNITIDPQSDPYAFGFQVL